MTTMASIGLTIGAITEHWAVSHWYDLGPGQVSLVGTSLPSEDVEEFNVYAEDGYVVAQLISDDFSEEFLGAIENPVQLRFVSSVVDAHLDIEAGPNDLPSNGFNVWHLRVLSDLRAVERGAARCSLIYKRRRNELP